MDPQMAELAIRMIEKPLRKFAEKGGISYEQLMHLVMQYSRIAGDRASRDRMKMVEALLSGKLERALRKAEISPKRTGKLLKELDNLEGIVRKQALSLSSQLRPPKGGNPNSTPPSKILQVVQEFQRLTGKEGKSNRQAYKTIANTLKIKERTVRRICDPKEAERSGCNYLGSEAGKIYMAAIQRLRPRRQQRS